MTDEVASLPEWRVRWCQCPTNQHSYQVMFVRAADPDGAKRIARDRIERTLGIGWLTFDPPTQTRPLPVGSVVD